MIPRARICIPTQRYESHGFGFDPHSLGALLGFRAPRSLILQVRIPADQSTYEMVHGLERRALRI